VSDVLAELKAGLSSFDGGVSSHRDTHVKAASEPQTPHSLIVTCAILDGY
jgi:hypothetical protein